MYLLNPWRAMLRAIAPGRGLRLAGLACAGGHL